MSRGGQDSKESFTLLAGLRRRVAGLAWTYSGQDLSIARQFSRLAILSDPVQLKLESVVHRVLRKVHSGCSLLVPGPLEAVEELEGSYIEHLSDAVATSVDSRQRNLNSYPLVKITPAWILRFGLLRSKDMMGRRDRLSGEGLVNELNC